jgi:ComF family protein
MDYDAIFSVPMHKKKQRERSYNQSSVLARFMGAYLNKPVLENQLKRVRNTPSQTNLSKPMRKKNVENAFKVTGLIEGKKILLVDDVITTGSTANECTKELMKSGAEIVDVFAISNPVITQSNSEEDGKIYLY